MELVATKKPRKTPRKPTWKIDMVGLAARTRSAREASARRIDITDAPLRTALVA